MLVRSAVGGLKPGGVSLLWPGVTGGFCLFKETAPQGEVGFLIYKLVKRFTYPNEAASPRKRQLSQPYADDAMGQVA